MKMMKKATILFLLLASVLSLSACGGSKQEAAAPSSGTSSEAAAPAEKTRLDEIKEAGVLVMGTSADYPPCEFHTEIDGVDTIVGFDVAIAQYFADQLGVELKVVDMNFDSLLISLSKGDFDIVLAGISNTPERAKAVDFTNVLFHNSQVAIIRTADADAIPDQAALAGRKSAVQTGSTQVAIANEVAGEENVVGLAKFNEMILELKNGKVDAVFTNSMNALPWVSNNDDLTMITLDIEDAGYSCAVQKGDTELQEFLNEQIESMREQGLFAQYVVEAQKLAGVMEE